MKYHIEFDLDFKRNPYKGLYIAIEGIDGSGKTTQVERIGEYFKKQGKEVVLVKEPSDEGIIGELVRSVLRSKVKIPPTALQFLFSADRSVRHQTITEPALKEGKVVITDRCFWSVIPYGIMDREQDAYKKETGNLLLIAQGLLSHYHQFIVPDITLYLRVSVDTALKRIAKAGKAKEIYEKKEKLEKIVKGYQWLLERFPKEIMVVDAERSVEEVTEEIIQNLQFSSTNSH